MIQSFDFPILIFRRLVYNPPILRALVFEFQLRHCAGANIYKQTLHIKAVQNQVREVRSMQSSGKRLIFVLAVVFALAAGRLVWLYSQSEPSRVQAQNAPLQLPSLHQPQKIALTPPPSNCDQQKSVVARMGSFPVLQLAQRYKS